MPPALGLLLVTLSILLLPGMHFAHAQSQTPRGNPIEALPTPALPFGSTSEPLGARTLAPQPQPQPQAQAQAQQGLAVTPARFEIQGVQAISFDEVAALFAPFAGKVTTVGQLGGLARQVTAIYQREGYPLSFAYLPEQDFNSGTVRVTAVEGYIATLRIEGEAGKAEPTMRALADRIRRDRPLRLKTFERYTQLMGLLPGVSVEATAVPAANTDGAGELQLKVVRQPYQVSLGIASGTPRPRAIVTAVVNDPLVSGGKLSGSALLVGQAGERYGALTYSQMVGSDGLTLSGEASLYQGNPDARLKTPPAISRYTTYRRAELSARYPLLVKQRETVFIGGGIYGVNNIDDYRNPVTGARLTDEVQVRAVYALASFSSASNQHARYLSLRLTRGLDGLGASTNISANVPGVLPVNPARLSFTRIGLDANQRNDWGGRWGTVVSLDAQYSPHILPSTERISFGGTRFAHGYAAGEVASDSGWGIGLELNRSFAVDMAYVTRIQPYLLLEEARIYSQAGTLALSRLSSASAGVRVSGGSDYTVDITLSKPTGQASSENARRAPRLNALVNYNLNQR